MASVHATAPDPTSVYRYYDHLGMLIYVGITRQGMGRNVQHNGRADWWPFVARQDVEHYSSREAAAAREKELIRKYRPPFNKQHNIDQESLRATYLAYAGQRPDHFNAQQLYKLLDKQLPLDVVSQDGHDLVLRTRPEHTSLACTLRIKKGGASLVGLRGYGNVTGTRTVGDITYVYARTKATTVEIMTAVAVVAYKTDTKPHHVRIDKVLVSVVSA